MRKKTPYANPYFAHEFYSIPCICVIESKLYLTWLNKSQSSIYLSLLLGHLALSTLHFKQISPHWQSISFYLFLFSFIFSAWINPDTDFFCHCAQILLGFHGGKQGSGLGRGRSLSKLGDFLFVCLYVCSSIYLSLLLGHLARPESQIARPEAQPVRYEA